MAEAFSVVGKSLTKPDAYAKVSGQTKFADDLSLPRMLFGRILRSPYPTPVFCASIQAQRENFPECWPSSPEMTCR